MLRSRPHPTHLLARLAPPELLFLLAALTAVTISSSSALVIGGHCLYYPHQSPFNACYVSAPLASPAHR